jgi:hypothetical protein
MWEPFSYLFLFFIYWADKKEASRAQYTKSQWQTSIRYGFLLLLPLLVQILFCWVQEGEF